MVHSENLALEGHIIPPRRDAETACQPGLFASRRQQRQVTNVMQQSGHAGRAAKRIAGLLGDLLREDSHLHAVQPDGVGIFIPKRARPDFGDAAQQHYCVE